jgi:hypothetical protein
VPSHKLASPAVLSAREFFVSSRVHTYRTSDSSTPASETCLAGSSASEHGSAGAGRSVHASCRPPRMPDQHLGLIRGVNENPGHHGRGTWINKVTRGRKWGPVSCCLRDAWSGGRRTSQVERVQGAFGWMGHCAGKRTWEAVRSGRERGESTFQRSTLGRLERRASARTRPEEGAPQVSRCKRLAASGKEIVHQSIVRSTSVCKDWREKWVRDRQGDAK